MTYAMPQHSKPKTNVNFAGVSTNADDQVVLYLAKTAAEGYDFEASVNPLGKCSTTSLDLAQRTQHSQCTTAQTKPDIMSSAPNCGSLYCWSGILTIPYEVLRANGYFNVNGRFDPFFIAVGRTLWEQNKENGSIYSSVVDFKKRDWTRARISIVDNVTRQRFAFIAPSAGNAAHHRAADYAAFPFTAHGFFSSTFADASGPILTVRDASLKDTIPKDQVKKFTCATCTAFQTDRQASFWDPVISSKGILGVGFDKVGVDSEPFVFDAVGYPVDAGVKLISASDWMTVALAAMRGSTDDGRLANDLALTLSAPLTQGQHALRASAYHVSANRSMDPKTAATRSVNSEVSLAYTDTQSGSTGVGGIGMDTGTISTFATMLRYGTQYLAGGQRFDAAVSYMQQPGYAQAQPKDIWQWNIVLGYRSVGAAYAPIDADFDPESGLRGIYGAVQYMQPQGARRPISLAIIAHRFSDSVEPRDTALTTSLSVQFGRASPFALNINATNARLAVSQVARLKQYTGPFSPEVGALYLPNHSYALNLVYKGSANLQASIGYTNEFLQNCISSSTPSPCYAYRRGNVTGTFYWFMPSNVFIAGSMQGVNNVVAGEPWSISPGSFLGQQSTANHRIVELSAGFLLPHLKCSSFTFTTVNRGGQRDSFAAKPPKVGYTNTLAATLAPERTHPGVLLAYSQDSSQGSADLSPTLNKQFFVRLLFGSPNVNFVSQSQNGCQ
jgi:hypothetical protein